MLQFSFLVHLETISENVLAGVGVEKEDEQRKISVTRGGKSLSAMNSRFICPPEKLCIQTMGAHPFDTSTLTKWT